MSSELLQRQARSSQNGARKYFGAYFCGAGDASLFETHADPGWRGEVEGLLREFRLSVPRFGGMAAWSFRKEPIGKISQDCIALSPA
jgi:hypothetical protein